MAETIPDPAAGQYWVVPDAALVTWNREVTYVRAGYVFYSRFGRPHGCYLVHWRRWARKTGARPEAP